MGWFGIDDDRSLVRACGAVGVMCSAWNLFGDLYLMDFFTAHMRDDAFGMIRDEARSGHLFRFGQGSQWVIFLVQAGGWMYPIWATATAIPLYIGLQEEGGGDDVGVHGAVQRSGGSPGSTFGGLAGRMSRATAPCALLVYGLCVVGGAFHGAFAFVTVLPNAFHYPPSGSGGGGGSGGNDDDGWSGAVETGQFAAFLDAAQTRILQHIFAGGLPGLVAFNVASAWIALLVHRRSGYHQFPRTFNLCNPLMTAILIQALGAILPDPVGLYLAGCIGTWGLLFLNVGTTYCLWNARGAGAGAGAGAGGGGQPNFSRSPDPGYQSYQSYQGKLS